MEEGKAPANQDSAVPLVSALTIPVADVDDHQATAATTRTPPPHPATTGVLKSAISLTEDATHNTDPTPVRNSNAATVALTCGILSIVCALVGSILFFPLVPLVFVSVVLGPIAICQGKKANREEGSGKAGIITGIVGTTISVIAIAFLVISIIVLAISFSSY